MRCMRGCLPWFLVIAGLWAAGCTPRYVQTERGPQAYYQTGYPIRDTSVQLERILRSVKRIQVTGFYETFRFAQADAITRAAVRDRDTYRKATERFTFDHTKTGSATIIDVGGGRATMVTNEHVTALPDTIVVYYRDRSAGGPGRGLTGYVESVSILTGRRDLVLGMPDNRPFTVTARDSLADVAAITTLLSAEDAPGSVAPLRIAVGDPSKLAWGSFVYVLGYPRGFRMVTRGIVSEPNRTTDHSFLLDGLFNRGISGGLVVAVRGDTNELEWVGLATSASAEAEYILLPESRALEEEGMLVPYEGRLYLERSARIDYGITFSVPVTAVRRVLRDHRIPFAVPVSSDR